MGNKRKEQRRPRRPAGVAAASQSAPATEQEVVLVEVEGTDDALVFSRDAFGLEAFGLSRLLAAHELAVPGFGHADVSTSFATAASTLNVGAQAASGALAYQGLYRLGPQTQSLLSKGASFMTKDGMRLGALVRTGRIVKPVQLLPAGGASAATFLAGIGPAIVLGLAAAAQPAGLPRRGPLRRRARSDHLSAI